MIAHVPRKFLRERTRERGFGITLNTRDRLFDFNVIQEIRCFMWADFFVIKLGKFLRSAIMANIEYSKLLLIFFRDLSLLDFRCISNVLGRGSVATGERFSDVCEGLGFQICVLV